MLGIYPLHKPVASWVGIDWANLQMAESYRPTHIVRIYLLQYETTEFNLFHFLTQWCMIYLLDKE
jgi:hypothetical protein